MLADLDTGVQWDHPALLPHYRGWNGITATHDYNWFDPVGESVSSPTDDQGHGTHTTGTLVGDDGAGTQTGVAPVCAMDRLPATWPLARAAFRVISPASSLRWLPLM